MNQIGPYQIISELGRGGMALVYRALQPSVNRIVALKVLPPHMETDAEALERFRREAETAANLTHEHIVKVWDASVTNAPFYIAMEFLDGGTLADRLAAGPLPVEQAVSVAGKVCAALHHAHQRGVVHRDIKPANIMFGAGGRPVVTDFGIARASEKTQLTAPGAKFGTPNYMAPEQASGLPIDGRTDIYSAGAVLYEMVTGRPPFGSDDPLAVMYRIVNEQPLLPSALNPGVPRALDAVVLRSLEKDPRHRYQTGGEMAAALAAATRPVIELAPTLTSLPTPPLGGKATAAPRKYAPAKGRRRWALALGLLLAVLAVGAGAAAYLSANGLLSRPGADQPNLEKTSRDQIEAVAPAGDPRSQSEQPALLQDDPSPEGSGSAHAAAVEPRKPEPLALVGVPDVVGKPSGEARTLLQQAGFSCSPATKLDGSVAAGRVISQDPAAGSREPPGTAVRITVSSGPPPAATGGQGRTRPRPAGKPSTPVPAPKRQGPTPLPP